MGSLVRTNTSTSSSTLKKYSVVYDLVDGSPLWLRHKTASHHSKHVCIEVETEIVVLFEVETEIDN